MSEASFGLPIPYFRYGNPSPIQLKSALLLLTLLASEMAFAQKNQSLADLDTLTLADGRTFPVLVIKKGKTLKDTYFARPWRQAFPRKGILKSGYTLGINKAALPTAQYYLGHRDVVTYLGVNLVGNASNTRRTNRIKLEMLDSARTLRNSAFLRDSTTHLKRRAVNGKRRPFIGSPEMNFIEFGGGVSQRVAEQGRSGPGFNYSQLSQRARYGTTFTARVGRIYKSGLGLMVVVTNNTYRGTMSRIPDDRPGDTTFTLKHTFIGLGLVASTPSAPLQGVLSVTPGIASTGVNKFNDILDVPSNDYIQVHTAAALRIRLSHRFYTSIEGSYLFRTTPKPTNLRGAQLTLMFGFRV